MPSKYKQEIIMQPNEIAELDSKFKQGPWGAIGPDALHPIPNSGARLCKKVPGPDGTLQWVVVCMGHLRVMTQVAEKANKEEAKFTQETVRQLSVDEGFPKLIAGMSGVTDEGTANGR